MKEKIKTIRHQLDLTQEQFAHELGVTVATVNRWENEHSQPARLARMRIAELCSCRGIIVDDKLNLIDVRQLTRAS